MARKKSDASDDGRRIVAKNKKARHRFEILDTFEAGIALTGNEVKSIREGNISIEEGYARIRDGDLRLVDCHIAPYRSTGFDQPEPKRSRRLLMRRMEVKRLRSKVVERGFTLVPLTVYFKGPWAKVEIALVRGKGQADKRETMKERSHKREMERAVRRKR